MNFRKALIKDVPVLSQLRVDMLNEKNTYTAEFNSILSYHTNDYLKNGIEQNSVLTIVAEKEDKIVSMGCIGYFILPPNDWCPSGKTAYAGNLFTIPPISQKWNCKRNFKQTSCRC